MVGAAVKGKGKRKREDGEEEGRHLGAAVKRQRVDEEEAVQTTPLGPVDPGAVTDDEDTMPEVEYSSRMQKTGTTVVGCEEEICLFSCQAAGGTHIGHRTENQDTFFLDPTFDAEALVHAVCGSMDVGPVAEAEGGNPFSRAFGWEPPRMTGATVNAVDTVVEPLDLTESHSATDGGSAAPLGTAPAHGGRGDHCKGSGSEKREHTNSEKVGVPHAALAGPECGTLAPAERDDRNHSTEEEERVDREQEKSNSGTGKHQSNQDTETEDMEVEEEGKRFAATVGIYAVFDGHGKMGKEAAEIALKMVPCRVRQYLPDMPSVAMTAADVEMAVTRALADTQRQLLRSAAEKNESDQEFGTTCILAVLWGGNKLTVANVGDSRAVLYRKMGENGDGRRRFIPLSQDHNLTGKEELERIFQQNGRVIRGKGGVRRVIPAATVPRQIVMTQQLALAMSRSLGHLVLSRFGVSPLPEFQTIVIQPDDILVLASDGLWDLFLSSHLERRIDHLTSLQKFTDELIRDVLARCKTQNRTSDNTTVVTVRFSRHAVLPFDSAALARQYPRMQPADTAVAEENSLSAELPSTPLLSRSSIANDLQRCDTAVLEDSN